MRRGITYRSLLKKISFNDWFLPSKDELNQMYVNLHLHGVGNFIGGGLQLIYGSSSEAGATLRWQHQFSNGFTGTPGKNSTSEVRPSRVFVSSNIYSLRDRGPANGWIYYITDLGGGSYRYYEAGPTDLGQVAFSNIVNQLAGTNAGIGTGQANTTAIIGQVGHIDSAAKRCDDLVVVVSN